MNIKLKYDRSRIADFNIECHLGLMHLLHSSLAVLDKPTNLFLKVLPLDCIRHFYFVHTLYFRV